jgi:Spy/CpxP family protein refolding chaperone
MVFQNINPRKGDCQMKKISIIAAVLLVIATATLAMAGRHGRMGFDGNRQMNPAITEVLDLTNEQTEKVQALHDSAAKITTPIRAQIVTKRAEMKLLWMQPTLDADKIKATQKEIQALMVQIRDTRTDTRITFRNLLTPEQTSKLLASGFGKGGSHKKGGGYGKGQSRGCNKGKGCGNWGNQYGECPRNK